MSRYVYKSDRLDELHRQRTFQPACAFYQVGKGSHGKPCKKLGSVASLNTRAIVDTFN